MDTNKLISMILACIIVTMLGGCETIGHTDPTHDPTKLWPAYDNNVNKWGYINEKGKMVIPAQFDEVAGFSCGYARVKKDDVCHYIDTRGKIKYSINPPEDSPRYTGIRYDYIGDFRYNYALIMHYGSTCYYGLIDRDFEYVIHPGECSGLQEVSESGYVPFTKDGWGGGDM